MADADSNSDNSHDVPKVPPEAAAGTGVGRVKRRRRISAVAIVLGLAVCFFVGRRIYYRLIQPEPPWEIPTSKNEVVVAAPSMQVALWADESLVSNPTSLSVDSRGRLWVTEAVNYRGWQNHQEDSAN